MRYIIYRSGSNSANQSLNPGPVPIAIVEATDESAATRTTWNGRNLSVWDCPDLASPVIASVDDVNVWANQRLSAVEESQADTDDWQRVLEY